MENKSITKVKISDVATFNRGFQVPRARTDVNNTIPYLHYGDLYKKYQNKIELKQELNDIIKISKDEKYKDSHLLQHNNIVFNLTSENYDDLGKTVIIKNKDNLPFISGMETTKCHIDKPSLLYPDYFQFYTQTKLFKSTIIQYVTGMKVFRVHPRDISQIELELPSLTNQIKISNVLSAIDAKIRVNRKINEKLESTAKSLFQEWFVKFNFPNKTEQPYKDCDGKFYETELGEIPIDWEVSSLDNIIDISSGKSIKEKSSTKNIDFKYSLIGASKVMAYTKEYNLDDKVLIIGRVGTLGVIQRINEKVWASDNTLIIKTKFHEYIYNLLQSIDYGILNRGSTQPLITQTDVKNLPVIIPDEMILNRFESMILPLSNKIEKNNKENETLEEIRNLLLNKLMSSKIDVDELDINWDKLEETLKEIE